MLSSNNQLFQDEAEELVPAKAEGLLPAKAKEFYPAKFTDGPTDGFWIFDRIESDRVKLPFLNASENLSGEELLH